MTPLIAPSILSANFLRLEDDIKLINQSKADLIHVDVMDGRFVPNITFGFGVIKQVRQIAEKPLDVHLMIEEPGKYIEEFKNAGANYLSVHYETCPHLNRTINLIKNLGMKAGVVLNPHNPVELLRDIVQEVDYILLMSVNPGFGQQKFIENTYNRIARLQEIVLKNNSKALIEIDGGVELNNIKRLRDAGASIFVAGSSIFGSKNPLETISKMKDIL